MERKSVWLPAHSVKYTIRVEPNQAIMKTLDWGACACTKSSPRNQEFENKAAYWDVQCALYYLGGRFGTPLTLPLAFDYF